MTGLHHSCACWQQVELLNLELIGRMMPDSSTNSLCVPHYHPMLVEIWTDTDDELAGQVKLHEFSTNKSVRPAGRTKKTAFISKGRWLMKI
jgi:hypothetical protein